jgi:hypothetical protein
MIQEERGRYQGVEGNRYSRGSGEVHGVPGDRNSTGFESGSRTQRETGVDTEPSGSQDVGRPKSMDSRTGEAGTAGNRRPRSTGNEAQAATGNRSCSRFDESEVVPGDRCHQRAETNFRKCRATGTSTEHRATGVAEIFGQPEISIDGVQARSAER